MLKLDCLKLWLSMWIQAVLGNFHPSIIIKLLCGADWKHLKNLKADWIAFLFGQKELGLNRVNYCYISFVDALGLGYMLLVLIFMIFCIYEKLCSLFFLCILSRKRYL